jgi:catechol 2,3-dioxygenase-like lactoylglutathione lyase family enzyme
MPKTTPFHTTPKVTALTPFVHVADVERSLAFYALLGMAAGTRYRDDRGVTVWSDAQTSSGDGSARIMLSLASGPVDPTQQAVLFYLYAPDVRALRAHLLASGLHDGGRYCGQAGPNGGRSVVFEVQHPHYMPAGEIRVSDPDGYVLLIGQLE